MANHPQETRIIPRQCGGWLALSGGSDEVQIGVTAPTASEAEAKLAAALAAWRLILASSDALSASGHPAICH